MLELMLSLFGMSRANKLLSNFLFGMAITVPTMAFMITLNEIYHAANIPIMIVQIASEFWAAINVLSMLFVKIKCVKILEIYDELNYSFSKMNQKPSGYFHSSVTWVIYHVITYLSVVITSFEANDILFSFFEIIMSRHHIAISTFYWNTWILTIYQAYCGLHIRYLYLVEMEWKRLEKVHIKPSYFLLLEIRQSLNSLKVSEKNLGDVTYYILYFVIAHLMIITFGIVLTFNFDLTLAFYVPYIAHITFLLVNFFSFYLYIKKKRKFLAKIEEKLSNWNY